RARVRLAARPGAPQRALRRPRGDRARRTFLPRARPSARPRARRPRPPRPPPRPNPRRAAGRRDPAERHGRARATGTAGATAVILTRLGVGAAAGWAAYAWGAHLLTLGCAWRGSRAGRRVRSRSTTAPTPSGRRACWTSSPSAERARRSSWWASARRPLPT